MNIDKLTGWLNISASAWPTDHYSLIGLARGAGTAVEIESRVLERLEHLRNHQLAFPDEATEGMNLLARALDTLTDPNSRRAYDDSLGLKTSTMAPPLVADDFDELFSGIPLVAAPLPTPNAEPAELPMLTATLLLPDIEDDPEVDDDPEFVAEGSFSGELELPEAILIPVLPAIARLVNEPSKLRRPTSGRRDAYADLARIRKIVRVFDRARPYLVDTDRTFARRTDSLALMGCFAELRPLLPTVADIIGASNRPGMVVAKLVRQRMVFDTFRSLVPSQRDSLAKDFRSAHYRLASYYEDLRKSIRQKTAKTWTRLVLAPACRHFRKFPEWIFVPIGAAILLIAAIRSL